MSVDTITALRQQVVSISDKVTTTDGNAAEASAQLVMHIDFQIRMLKNLLSRSQSNKERLQNEIALVGAKYTP